MRSKKLRQGDDPRIDQIYGLEPVFEPGAHAGLEAWAELKCPYCGETSSSSVDLTDQSRSYIEDCQVCCQAMYVTVRVDNAGKLQQIAAKRMDD